MVKELIRFRRFTRYNATSAMAQHVESLLVVKIQQKVALVIKFRTLELKDIRASENEHL